MGGVTSVLYKFGCLTPTWDYICYNYNRLYLNRWMGHVPESQNTIHGLNKIAHNVSNDILNYPF